MFSFYPPSQDTTGLPMGIHFSPEFITPGEMLPAWLDVISGSEVAKSIPFGKG